MNYLLERLEEIGYPALVLLVLGIVLAFGAKPFWERMGKEGEHLAACVLYTKLAALALVLASVLLGMVL
ncbi:hypothetical protein [Clostridium sp. BSD2780061688b_171218_E8]|nr:hypothetical protein [Clostridium sp. BSD2780061688b_171218_E8]